MKDLEIVYNSWNEKEAKPTSKTALNKINFEEIQSSIFSVGPSYFYIVDFFDMSLSHVSDSIFDIHGFDPKTVTFNDVLSTIHPDDLSFVSAAESSILDFFYKQIGYEKLKKYKTNYSFRSKMKDGSYALLNHQALMLSLDASGGMGKALNIHTRIDHLNAKQKNAYSLIGLKNEPSYIDIEVLKNLQIHEKYTKRETEIIKFISEGLSSEKIAIELKISVETIKKHRSNFLKKSGCKNMNELIKIALLQGLI